MPYRIEWQLEKRIGKLTVWDEFSLEEIGRFACQYAVEYLDNAYSPVHLIADFSRMEKHPLQIAQLQRAAAPFLQHPNMGWLVIAGSTPLVGYLATIVTHITHTHYRAALSVEDALKNLKRVDVSLV